MSIMDNSIVSTCPSNYILKALHMAIAVIYFIWHIIYSKLGEGGNLHADIYSENFSFRHVEKK